LSAMQLLREPASLFDQCQESPESFICREFFESFINPGEYLSFSRDDQHVVE
jgi:hypothetical protein